jgi:hypothetical protein
MADESSLSDDRPVWVRPTQATCGRFQARVESIAPGGVRLTASVNVPVGDLLSIELASGTAQLARVVRVDSRPGGASVLSCVLARELGDKELQPFGARRVQPPPGDLRRWARLPCDAEVAYQTLTGSVPRSGTGRITNISPGGAALELTNHIEVGTLVSLELRGPYPGYTLPVLAYVVYVMGSKGSWCIGCSFVRELTDADLRALLL